MSLVWVMNSETDLHRNISRVGATIYENPRSADGVRLPIEKFSQARQDKARLLWWPNEYITTGNSILAAILTGTF